MSVIDEGLLGGNGAGGKAPTSTVFSIVFYQTLKMRPKPEPV